MAVSTLSIFLNLDGIPGQSTAKGHEHEIDVVSYTQGIEATLVQSGTGGASSGKVTFRGVRFRKAVDAASLAILMACASGQHIAEARFAFRHAPDEFDFDVVTLEEVLITRVTQEAGAGPQYPLSFDALTAGADAAGFLEEVTLSFARIRWQQRAISPNGAVAVTASGGWDVKANKRL